MGSVASSGKLYQWWSAKENRVQWFWSDYFLKEQCAENRSLIEILKWCDNRLKNVLPKNRLSREKKLVCCLPKSLIIREERKPQNNSQESNFITLSGLSESFEVNSWVEFLEGRFLDEKLPFLNKTKTEHSFELYLSIFCLLTVYF